MTTNETTAHNDPKSGQDAIQSRKLSFDDIFHGILTVIIAGALVVGFALILARIFGHFQIGGGIEDPSFGDHLRGAFQFVLAGAAVALHAVVVSNGHPETEPERGRRLRDAACTAIGAAWIVGGAALVSTHGLVAPMPWQLLAFPATIAVATPAALGIAPLGTRIPIAHSAAPAATAWLLFGWFVHEFTYADDTFVDVTGNGALDAAIGAAAWPAIPIEWLLALPPIFPFTTLMALLGGICLFIKSRKSTTPP